MASEQKTKNSIVWANRPATDDYGQYFYDPTSEYFEFIYPGLGTDVWSSHDDLYSIVREESEEGSIDFPDNRLFHDQKFWQYYGMGFRIDSIYVNNRRNSDNWRNQIGIYLFDEASAEGQELLQLTDGEDIMSVSGFVYGSKFTTEPNSALRRMLYYKYDTRNRC